MTRNVELVHAGSLGLVGLALSPPEYRAHKEHVPGERPLGAPRGDDHRQPRLEHPGDAVPTTAAVAENSPKRPDKMKC